ncbi:MAG: hypothetical protein ABI472_02965 [Ginsengibacter sp.]
MKTDSTQQEILLLTGTSFSNREWCEKISGDTNHLTSKEQLEEACWNGLLREILPEIYMLPGSQKKLFIWQIKEGKSFIELELGEIPGETDEQLSINPYLFLHFQSLN